ncbi:cell division protein ZapA [Maritimibacter sp. 55A14]|uniref:cell division protein ZapA n=1 Tax=Maritimibacter sp. 55A14 TaxID=2174844 RepID=UPI000D604F2A|nr:cell division protein ZapA [Maritimibacter sp. 55A14]PWE30669.1 cell division protein ZapA [Maritimibacter sp. 55A14]
MPEVSIEIGGRVFQVACQDGEEHFLRAAAAMLDGEAQVLAEQIGRLPESRMLLMAALMLADKTAGLEEDLRALRDDLAEKQALIEEMRETPAPAPKRVEVPVIPAEVTETMAEIAARAEALADQVEERAAG